MTIRETTQRFSHADNNIWKPLSATTDTLFCLASDMHSLRRPFPATAGSFNYSLSNQFTLVDVHAFYFDALQLISGFYSPY